MPKSPDYSTAKDVYQLFAMHFAYMSELGEYWSFEDKYERVLAAIDHKISIDEDWKLDQIIPFLEMADLYTEEDR